MKSILIIITFFISQNILSQDISTQNISRNNIYLELGGPALIYSVNYEHLLTKNNDKNFPIRIGFFYSTQYFNHNNIADFGIPLSISLIKKINNSKTIYYEIKAITTIAFYEETNRGGKIKISDYYYSRRLVPGISIGIRRQPNISGLYFHFHFLLSYNPYNINNVSPFLSLGIGKSFL